MSAEAIVNPNSALHEKGLRAGDAEEAAKQAIANAERALQKLSVNFEVWMVHESKQLCEARDAAKGNAYSQQSLPRLFQAAHNLMGQAITLGYPFADEICASLCRLIDHLPDKSQLPVMLVDQHVDAVRALVNEGAKGDDNPMASVLAKRLRDVTDDFLQRQSTS